MHLQLALVCNDARATDDGRLDVHGIFHDLFAPGFPAKQDRMVLVLGIEWDRADEGRHQFRVDLTDPVGKPSLRVDGHTDVDRRTPDRPPARTRLVLPLEEVVFPTAGRYSFDIRIKGKRLRGPTLHLFESEPDPHAESGPA
jgi:hypothetical protein